MTTNCTPCSDSPSGGTGPTIVTCSKYVSVTDLKGNPFALKPKEDSILVHRSGAKPVSWANGSKDDRIGLPQLEKSAKAGASVVFQDNSGFLFGAQPDESKGKQIITAEAGAVSWEPFGKNRHCFSKDDITEVAGGECGYQIAAFTKCAPDGQVCLVKLPADQCGSLTSDGTFKETSPAGVMQMYGGTPSSVPDGWLLCDGRIVDPAVYPALFNRIGYNFGRDGSNFMLPDMRGVVPRGVDDTGIRDPDFSSRTESGANSNVAENVGSYQEDAIQCHEHGGGGFTVTENNTTIGPGDAKNITYVEGVVSEGNTSGIAESECGVPRTADETRMKNIYVNFIISVGC